MGDYTGSGTSLLNEAVQQNNSIAGTALLGMHRLSAVDAAFDQDAIKSLALRFASSTNTETSTRITAIQVCAERGLKEILPIIQAAAQFGETVSLKVSAIAALGRLGDKEQLVVLEHISEAEHADVRVAVQKALKQLRQTLAERDLSEKITFR